MAGNIVAALSGAIGMNLLGAFVAQLIVRDKNKRIGGVRFLLIFLATTVIVAISSSYFEGSNLQNGIVLLISLASNAIGIVLLRKDFPNQS